MTITTSAWTHPTTGQTRHYINDWAEQAFGLEIARYNTGNISSAALDGEHISNTKAARLGGKIWADDNGELHLDYVNGWYAFYTEAEMLEKLNAWIKAEGGLDFLTPTEPKQAPEPAETTEDGAPTVTPKVLATAAAAVIAHIEATEDTGDRWSRPLVAFRRSRTQIEGLTETEQRDALRELRRRTNAAYAAQLREADTEWPTPDTERILRTIAAQA